LRIIVASGQVKGTQVDGSILATKVEAEAGPDQVLGAFFELTSTADLSATFKRVADELHHQYVIGFTPVKLDGKTHKLELLVKGGSTVRARRSYLASTER
jgi:hypothetical protein